MNGIASSSERARASSSAQAINGVGKSSTARSSTLLTPAQAGPSGVTKTANGSSMTHTASTSSSSSAPRRASRKSYVFDSSDDDDACNAF